MWVCLTWIWDIWHFFWLKGLVKRETRFTSKRPVNEIISKIEEAASPLGFDVKKNNFKVLNNHFLSLLTHYFLSVNSDGIIIINCCSSWIHYCCFLMAMLRDFLDMWTLIQLAFVSVSMIVWNGCGIEFSLA